MIDSSYYSAALVEAVLQMVSTDDQNALFDLVLQTARQQLQIEQVSLIMFKPSHRETAAVLGTPVYDHVPGFNTLWGGIEGWVVREQTPVLSINPLQDVRISIAMQLALQQDPTLPLVVAAPCGEHGVLLAIHASLDKNSVTVLHQIGRAVTVALSRLEAHPSTPTILMSEGEIYWRSVELVGRGAHQVQLMQALTAAENEKGSVVVLYGQPGSGKTALIEWLCQEAHLHQFEVVQGYAQPHSAPYEVWRVVLKQLYSEPSPSLDSCKTFLKEINPRWEVRAGLLLNLLQTGHISDPTLGAYTVPQRHAATTNLIIDLLGRASQRHPLLIVIEEADQLSEGALDVLHHLSHRLKYQPHRLVICATSNTTLGRAYQKIQLMPLQLEHIVQLRQALVGDRTAAKLDEWLLAHTYGNPLYLRLLLGNLAEADLLQEPPDYASDVPTIVKALIERTPSHLQTTLYAAAILGSPFSFIELAAIHPEKLDDDALQDALEALAEDRLTARWWLLDGQIQQVVGNSDQALASYRRALEHSGGDQQPAIYAAMVTAGDDTYLHRLHALDLNKTAYPALVYSTLAEIDPRNQQVIMAAAHEQILAKAAKIEDEQIHQQYLSRPDRQSLLEFMPIAS